MRKREKRRIVHIVTRIQAVFGVLDAQGNVTRHIPVNVEITRFDRAAFVEAHTTLQGQRSQVLAVTRKSPVSPAPTRKGE